MGLRLDAREPTSDVAVSGTETDFSGSCVFNSQEGESKLRAIRLTIPPR